MEANNSPIKGHPTRYDSVVARYRHALTGIEPSAILAASLGEHAALLGPYTHRGVEISLLDLSSKNPTGTFKDWLGCVTIAFCLERGITEFVTQSSGNTANALARYAEPHGIKVHIFYPRRSAYKILPQVAESSRSIFHELDCPEPEVKTAAAEFAVDHGLPMLPDLKLQIEANKLRAYLLDDPAFIGKAHFDYHVQALSSAYGVIGYYHGLAELNARGRAPRIPRLLGVQQSAVAPYFTALYNEPPLLAESLIEPTLFRSSPTPDLISTVRSIVTASNGRVTRVRPSRYRAHLDAVLEMLGVLSFEPRISPITLDYTEKAPLLALIGLFEEIERGAIQPGESALAVMTGGFGIVPTHHFCPLKRPESSTETIFATPAKADWSREQVS